MRTLGWGFGIRIIPEKRNIELVAQREVRGQGSSGKK